MKELGRTVANLQFWLKAIEITVDWTLKKGTMSMTHEESALATNPTCRKYQAHSCRRRDHVQLGRPACFMDLRQST